MDGKTYAYAVVARKDQPGLVLCYEDVTGYKEVDNELSLDTLLSGNNFTMEAAIIITDGASIINSNDETKKNKSISGTVVETAEKQGWDDNTMQKIKSDGQTWYVMRRSYKDNHLYVFYTSGEVFTYRTTTMAYAVLLYLLFASFFHMIHYQYARKNTEYIEKQYQIIQAISTIYSTDIRGMVKIGKHNLEKPEKEAEYLDKIEEASGFLLDLVNDVLDMKKLESGEIVLEEEPFDFKKILQDSVTVVETQAAAAGVTFHRERAGGTDGWNDFFYK